MILILRMDPESIDLVAYQVNSLYPTPNLVQISKTYSDENWSLKRNVLRLLKTKRPGCACDIQNVDQTPFYESILNLMMTESIESSDNKLYWVGADKVIGGPMESATDKLSISK